MRSRRRRRSGRPRAAGAPVDRRSRGRAVPDPVVRPVPRRWSWRRSAWRPRRAEAREERPRELDVTGLDAAWAAAQGTVPSWRTTSVRLGGPAQAPFVITVDEGYGGQPQYRRTLSVDRASAAIVKSESFDDLGPGRRLRSWLRFAHTGEIYGLPGQTVAGLVSAGGAVLVYTGIALALRRFVAWLRRRSAAERVVKPREAA